MTPELQALRPQITAPCEQFWVRRLELFGSAVDARQFEPDRSDVDLLVQFDALHAWHLCRSLPLGGLLGRPIDLVVERAVRNPNFRESVEALRELRYAA